MDYRNLLSKYMNHVGNEEGITFIPYYGNELFTEEEIDELKKIDSEI